MHLFLRQFDQRDLQFWEISLPQKHSHFLHSSFHNTVYCAWLFPSKYLPLNSMKASIHHFICLYKLLFLSPLPLFLEERIQRKWIYACVLSWMCQKSRPHASGFRLTGMYFFITQTWEFHWNDHNNWILLKRSILARRRKNSHKTNSLVALMTTFNDNF